jgi:hypothetical protein
MTIMLDIVLSVVIFGMLMLMVANINVTLTTENYRGIVELNTETELIQLANIMEFDLNKAGYHVPSVDAAIGERIAIADSSRIRFFSDLKNNGIKIPVEYSLLDYNSSSTNPRDRMLVRIENTSTVYINYSVTKFKLSYYNTRDSIMSTPITGSLLDSIRSIKIILMLESPHPFDTTSTPSAMAYAHAMYQKLIFPRNLTL